MKMTVVPAQVTTVEDRIIGNLGFSQILLLIVPLFVAAGVFVLLPPFISGAAYKYVFMVAIGLVFCILAIRIRGKILAFWLVMIMRYNRRPRYYLFNKNVMTMRENYPLSKEQEQPEKTTAATVKKHGTAPRLDIAATAKVLATIENPAARVRFETGKKGGLHVRLTEVEEQD